MVQKKPITRLIGWAKPILDVPMDQRWRSQLISLARTKAPTAAQREAQASFEPILGRSTAINYSRAVNALATIRRDYGGQVFENIVGESLSK